MGPSIEAINLREGLGLRVTSGKGSAPSLAKPQESGTVPKSNLQET